MPPMKPSLPVDESSAEEAQVITVVHLYELNGTDTGYGRTVGYYEDSASAANAGHALGHNHWEYQCGLPALRLKDGIVYLLRQKDPVRLG
jgi:hypothetical protein